jgi:hypothetical protein
MSLLYFLAMPNIISFPRNNFIKKRITVFLLLGLVPVLISG